MSPRNVILICGLVLIALGGIVALTEYMGKGKNEEIQTPAPHKKYRPEQPVSFDHQLHTGQNMNCSNCHTGYTLKDTAMIPN